MVKFLQQSEGFDGLPATTLQTNYPWQVLNLTAGVLVDSSSGVDGGNSLRFMSTPNQINAAMWRFNNGGTLSRTNELASGEAFFAFSGWIKMDSNTTTASNIPLISIGSNDQVAKVLMTTTNNPAAGMTINFPQHMNTHTGYTYSYSIQTNVWYNFNIRLLISGKKAYQAISINDIEVSPFVEIPFTGALPTVNKLIDTIIFSTQNKIEYSLDDITMQATSGLDVNWPAGFDEDGVPNTPTFDMFPALIPIRITRFQPIANGSINEWTPSDDTLDNWQAAKSTTEYVQSEQGGLTDLYKFNLPESFNPVDIQAVVVKGNTNKYTNVTPVMKKDDNQVVTIGNVSKGLSSFSTIIENVDGEQWTKEKINSTEFGQSTL